MTLTEL